MHIAMLQRQSKIYTDLHDMIEDIANKFMILKRKIQFNFTFHGKVITPEIRQKMEEVIPFIPKNPQLLRQRILIKQQQCLKA